MSLVHRRGCSLATYTRQSLETAVLVYLSLLTAVSAAAWEMEAGQTPLPATAVGSTFATVTFQATFSEPPLVFVMPTAEGAEPAAVRLRSVSTGGFQLVQVEAPAADGPHEAMVVDWIAVTPGAHQLPDGTVLEAGLVSTSAVQHGNDVTGTESWESVSFSASFAAPPAVLLALQTVANETATVPEQPPQPWLVVGTRNVTATGLELALERCEAAPGAVSASETVAYLAIEAGAAGSFTADDAAAVDYETAVTTDSVLGWGNGCYRTNFASVFSAPPLVVGHLNRHDGGDGGWLRRCAVDASGVELTVDEDTYRDAERNHTNEAAGMLVFSRAFYADIGGGPPEPSVALSAATSSVDEAAGSVVLTVTLSATSASDVSVDYATTDGTAAAGEDYTATSGTLTILSGQISGSITVPITDDAVAEGDEGFAVTLSNPTGATLGTPATATVTITDDEGTPELSFSAATSSVGEGAGSVDFTVSMSVASASDVTVDFATADGTATTGADYTATSGTLTIPAGQTSGAITVPITDDAVAEGDEEFAVTLSNPTGATLGTPATATVTITDDDGTPAGWQLESGTVTLPATTAGSGFVAVAFGQTYPAPPVVVTLVGMDGTAPSSVRVRNVTATSFELVQVEPGGADGPHEAETVHWLAVEQGQHTLADGTLVEAGTIDTAAIQFGAGVTGTESWASLSFSSAFPAPPVLLTELQTMSNEVATVPEAPSEPWLVVGARNVTATGAQIALERCESAPGAVTVPETVGYVAFEAGRSGTLTAIDSSTVAYETLASPDTIRGTDNGCAQIAFANSFANPPLVIGHMTRHDGGDGGWLRRCSVTTTDVDLVVDEDQYRDTERSHTPEAAGLVLFERAFVADFGGGGPAEPVVALDSLMASVGESSGSIDVTVVLSATSASDVTVDYATADGAATAGADYTTTTGTLTILAGQAGGTVTVPISGDVAVEGDEDFSVTISSPTGATLGTPDTTTVTIVDDDAPPPTVALSSSAIVVAEGAGSVDLTVVLSDTAGADVTVDYASADGTATAGSDYTLTSGPLTILAGQLTGTITVPILDDAVSEGDEDLSLTLSNPQGATLGTPATTTVTITDNDVLPEISFSAASSVVGEAAGSVTLNVELSAIAAGDVTVSWATADGTATAGADYTAASGSLVIPSGQLSEVIVVDLLDDAVQEGPESFTVTLTAPTGADLGSPATSTVTINDDEAPVRTVSFSVSPDTFDQLGGSPLVSISNAVATFSGDTVGFVVRRGQRLTYGVDGVAFIQGCSDALTCDVIRADGSPAPDSGPVAVTGLFYEFASIASALSGAATHLGTTDLVAANLVLELECYGDGSADTQAVDVSGWTTGSGRELVIRSAPGERHLGKWTDSACRLEVSGSAACIRSTVGDVVIDGLQLYCTDDAANDVAGVLFDGSGVTGVVEIADVLIRLDGATGAGARIGVAAPAVGDLELRIRNAIVWDLGSGTARHAGFLVEDDSVTARIAGVTVHGGSYGFRRTAGAAIVKSSLAVNATVADFAGAFDLDSTGNASSDATAPGSAANHDTKAPFVNPSTGTTADLHLECNPLASATITSVPIDIGSVNNLFDGNPRTLARSANVNPAWVLIEFPEPVTIAATAVAFSHADGHDWFVAMADSAADMSSQSGSYRVVVPTQEARPVGLPDPNYMWDEVQLAAPESGRVIRLEALKLGDAYVHLGEWDLEFVGTPCEAGADLSGDAVAPFLTDVDGENRIVPWDVGADESTFISAAFTQSSLQVWEQEGQAVLEVLLSDPAPAELAVAFRTVQSSATEGVDYTGASGELVFAAGEVRREITVPINDDGLPDDWESFSVELAAPGGGFTGGDWISVVLRDGASPVQVYLDPDSITVDEAAGSATAQVRLSAVSGGDVSLNWESNDITARMGLDYGATQGNLTIPAGELTADVTVPILDDSESESTELLSIKLNWSSGAELRSPTMTQVWITDNDDSTISLDAAAMTVGETAGAAQIAVVLSNAQDHDVSIDWAAAGGTATFGTDYTSAAGTVTVPMGQTSASFQIDIVDDAESEADETILLSLSNPVGITVGEPSAGTLTILDDDRLPVVSLATATLSTVETAGTVDLTVVLDQSGDVPVEVQMDTADATAVAPGDYAAHSLILTIPVGQTSGVVTITINDDGQPEGDETFTVSLTSPSGATLGTPATAVVTILGDTSLPSISFANAAYAVNEHEGPVVLDVVLDEVPVTEVSVQVTSIDGDAVAGADYTAVNQIVTFAVGETSKAVVIEITDDPIYEHAETFSVSLSAPSGAGLGTTSETTVTINQSDWPPFVYLADGGNYTAQYEAFEVLGEIVIPVRLSDPSGVTAEIDYATSGGTAVPGADYTEVSGTLTFDPGQTELFIVIPIFDDATPDNGEAFQITLSNPIDCTLDFLSPDDGVITIFDDLEFAFSQPSVSVSEGEANVQLVVTLSRAPGTEVTVEFSSADGTALAGQDYNAVSGALTFSPGVTSQVIDVPLIADTDIEDDETFSLSLSSSAVVPIGSPDTVEVTILDDERPEVAFSLPSYSVAESGGQRTLAVTLSFATAVDASVDFTTIDGSAAAGADYTTSSGTLTIPSGQLSGTITVSVLDDWMIEGSEDFSVILSNPQNAVLRAEDTSNVTIVDDDLAGVEVTPLSLQTTEEGGWATFTLVLTSQPTDGVAIQLVSGDPSEGAVSPASMLFDSSNWSIPQQATVTGENDSDIDGDIQYSVQTLPATSADLDYEGLDAADVNVNNLDDEFRTVIGEPAGRVYGDGDELSMDASASIVPSGYQTWFAVLRDDGSDPMDIVHLATGLTGTFVTSDADPAFRVRLVIALPGSMPTDEVLRGADLPCVAGVPDLGCNSTDVSIYRADGGHYPFRSSYVFPEALLLTWDGYYTDPNLALQRSDDGGQTWVDLPEPGNQDGESSIEFYASFPDRTVSPGSTYHYRILGYDTPPGKSWFYLGNTWNPPGDPVSTPVWSAPRPVPTFQSVTWNCPDGASRFLCYGTVTVRLDPVPGESLAGMTIRVFLNEQTFEALGGDGDPIRIIWPDTFPFAGRDEPGCVTPKAIADLEVTVPQGEDSVTIDIPNVVYGANSFRFEVDDGPGGFAERALIYGVHDEVGNYFALYTQLLPVLFGTDVVEEQFELNGLGPVGIRSPDCRDGDQRKASLYNPGEDIYSGQVEWFSVAVDGYVDTYVGTDDTGQWSANLQLTDGQDHNIKMKHYFGTFIGRSILDEDGNPITVDETSQEVLQRSVTLPYSSLHVDTTLDGPHPPVVDYVPGSVFSVADDEFLVVPVRFRITDLHHDVDVYNVTVANETLDPVQTVYAFYSEDQVDDNGHFGWFVAEVPMLMPAGETAWDNQLRIQGADDAGNILDSVVTVTRERPLVWADIAEPDPTEAEPRQLVTFDGTGSIVPGLGAGGGVARWVFLRHPYNGSGWEEHRDSGFIGGPAGLLIDAPMPDYSEMKARLVVAASLADFPADPLSEELPCLWNEGDGHCDAKEVVVDMFDAGCYQKPDNLGVVVDSPGSPVNIGVQDTLHLQAHITFAFSPVSYNWVLFDSDDTQLEWPLGFLGSGDIGWSVDNADTFVVPGDHGVGPGDYFLIAQARYPEAGCSDPSPTWYLGRSTAISLRIANTIDGVAPGQVVEGGTFRVYSKTWIEGLDGYVFIDDDPGDAVDPITYFGTVQPGGHLEITPQPGELPAMSAYWYVSVADDAAGTGRSIWWGGLKIEPAGDAATPLLVTNEEDPSCAGASSECAHPILPGQTWEGEWGEAGDQDFFYFPAGAGTAVRVTLERVDITLPPQHPDAPGPEILLARPDGVVFAASEPLALDATGASLDATLTLDGLYQIVARTPKGTGAYLVTLTRTAEGGLGAPSFGWTNDRTHLTTELRPGARLQAPLFDPFGNPISGARVSWEEGSDCGVGDFCGSGTITTERSSVDGAAVLDVQPAAGADPLWRPGTSLGPATKARPIGREGVAKRISQARSAEPFLGILRTSGTTVLSTDLPDLATAQTITAEARRRAKTRPHGDAAAKDGPLCGSHAETCSDSAPVFRAVQLSLDPGDDLVDLEVTILDGGVPTETLDGQTVLSDVSLTLEAVATVRDDQGGERQVAITDPIPVAVSRGAGGTISDGVATCATVDVTPGPFTYKVGNNAAIHQLYDEPDGSPCCWQPTEALYATVVVDAEVDDGQGGTIRITRQAETMVESIPRPADPCEVRSLQSGTPEIAAYDAYNLIEVGDVYLTDACGNIVYGVGLSDSENHDQPGDEFRITSPLDPPGEGVWATALSGNNQWSWGVRLHGDVGTPDQIPNGSYTVDFEVASQNPECSAGSYTVNTTMGAPQVALWWDWIWDAENSPRGPNPEDALISPGSAVRDRSGGVAMWRVPAFNDATVDHFFEGPYTGVPVKLYVASAGLRFDEDGALETTYLEPVEGVELCTGTIEKLTDAAGHLDWNSPVRTTCDTAWATFATAQASSDPEDTALNPAGPPDTWIPVGLGVGITKGPDQPGKYLLVAEPLDEAFRRGDSWKVITPYVPDGFVGFEVGGGMFLDEDWQVISSVDLLGSKLVHLKAWLWSDLPTVQVDLAFVDGEGTVLNDKQGMLDQVATREDGPSLYIGDINLINDVSPGKASPRKSAGSPSKLLFPVEDYYVKGPQKGILQAKFQRLFSILPLRSYAIELIRADGLYRPGGVYEEGYTATPCKGCPPDVDDDKGRIYWGWVYDPQDPHNLLWKTDHQYVDFWTSVVPDPPSGVRVKWTAMDVDDPSDTWPGVAEPSAAMLDPNDWGIDAEDPPSFFPWAQHDRVGDEPKDNWGHRVDGVWWEKVKLANGSDDPTYDLELGVDQTWGALGFGSIVDGLSKVRFNATDVGGDNFVVQASLIWADKPLESGRSDTTGIMTVWKRIKIEYKEMPGETVPVDQLQQYFDPAFVEVYAEPAVQVAPEHDLGYLGGDYGSARDMATQLCEAPPSGEFSKRSDLSLDGGWFLVMAAHKYYPPSPNPPPELGLPITRTVVKTSATILELVDGEDDMSADLANYALFVVVNEALPNSWAFPVESITSRTIQIPFEPENKFEFNGYRWHPLAYHFTPPEEYLIDVVDLDFEGLAIGVEPITVKIVFGHGFVEGVCPAAQGTGYSDANSIVFVNAIREYFGDGTPEFVEERLITLIHEIVHSFGLAHKCGLPQLSGVNSCAMNYDHAIMKFDGSFEEASQNPPGLCAQHIVAIRESPAYGGKVQQ